MVDDADLYVLQVGCDLTISVAGLMILGVTVGQLSVEVSIQVFSCACMAFLTSTVRAIDLSPSVDSCPEK